MPTRSQADTSGPTPNESQTGQNAPNQFIHRKVRREPWISLLVKRQCPSMEASLRWDGDPTTYLDWEEEALSCLRQGGVDGIAEHSRTRNNVTLEQAYGKELDTTGLSGQDLQDTLDINEERFQLIEAGKIDYCLALISYIAPSARGIVVDASNPDLRRDPDKLWDAIKKRMQVTTAHIGPKLLQELGDIKWVSKTKDGNKMSMVQQVEHMIAKYQRLDLRFRTAPQEFRVPEIQLVGSFCNKLPKTGEYSGVNLHIAEYRRQTKLADLLDVIRPHAIDVDHSAPTDMNAFVTVASPVTQDNTTSVIEKLLDKVNSFMADQQRRSQRGDRDRRMNRAAGPIQNGDKWCKVHGWNRSHTNETCRSQQKTGNK